MSGLVGLADIRRAASRIAGRIRVTPVLDPAPLKTPLSDDGAALRLKLECLQVSGSFEARGASNRVALLDAEARERGIVTASGGNHGLAVAYAARAAGAPATIYLPASTPSAKVEKLRA